MNKYTVITDKVESDLKNSHELSLFVRLWSGKYSKIDKDNLHTSFGLAKGTFNKAWKVLVNKGYVLEDENGWTVTDDPDPLHNHSAIPGSLFDKDNPLLNWLNEKCPRVQRLQKPITGKEAEQLMEDFNTDPLKKILKEVFTDMENHKPLNSKYVSANDTFRNWSKRRVEELPKFGKKPYCPTV